MDVFQNVIQSASARTLRTIDMHTVGEPTRIIIDGYPKLEGRTLLEKREYARVHCDHIRKQLMSEPRGHYDMYGAILVQDTEMTERGEADIGVLFCHNDGYSTMCGHATIALGRFLVDTGDPILFPNRAKLLYDSTKKTVELRLHAPCGIVRVSVPAMPKPSTSAVTTGPGAASAARIPDDRAQMISDPSRMVSFLSVPSFAAKKNLRICIPPSSAWPELVRNGKDVESYSVELDLAFGGAFYAIVEAEQLGFKGDACGRTYFDRESIKALEFATQQIKSLLEPRMSELLRPFRNSVEKDLQFLYGVTVVDGQYTRMEGDDRTIRADRNLCFFADSQLDRSPTGSCVAARTALAASKGILRAGECWEYNSIVSQPSIKPANELSTTASERFIGTLTETQIPIIRAEGHEPETSLYEMSYVVQVEGFSWYTGASAFVLEEGDIIGKGFLLGK